MRSSPSGTWRKREPPRKLVFEIWRGDPVLRKYSEVFRSLLAAADLVVVGAAWLGALWLRFATDVFPPPPTTPILEDYLWLLVGILPASHVLLRSRGLYEARRARHSLEESRLILEVVALSTLVFATATFLGKMTWVSRLTVLTFAGLEGAGLIAFRAAVRWALRRARRAGWNQRKVLIVGTGTLAREVAVRIRRRRDTGFRVAGFLGPSSAGLGGPLPARIGGYDDLRATVLEAEIDQVVIAVDQNDGVDIKKLVRELGDTTAAVRVVPDLLGIDAVQPAVEDLDGLPMLVAIENPTLGWGRIAKRGLDIAASATGLVVLSPLLGVAAAGVKLSSPGPLFYRQSRMGLDGRLFSMIKFRSMRTDAELESGAVWATKDDPRRTRFGAFIRRTSIDELPQLWNILKGEMSLVGPRPERPEFIAEFRQEMGGYMVRHKMKGGLTGWAQINGCRGDTSIEKRLEYDIAYMRRWSFFFDLKILWLTLFRAWNDPNAY